jgi:hypothetical protein
LSISEFGFSVDEFKNPKVYKNIEAVGTLLVRLLLLEPGAIQSHPDAGVGLMSRFRYSVEGSASKLQSEYQKQIETYLPQLQGVKISVIEKDRMFIIGVEINDSLYGISFDRDKLEITTNYTTLSNL